MTRQLQLSELAALIQETVEDRFYSDSFWIKAEITDVKKYESKRWCFLKFIEKRGSQLVTEMQAVFWANAYQHILVFERITRQPFVNGLEISCRVAVRFHPRFGLKLEVLEIDTSFALGQLELERRQTLERLLHENPSAIQLIDDEYISFNNQLKLPAVIQNIALITAPNSDGQRDFLQELEHNPHGYHFRVTQYLSAMQGETAAASIREQLEEIYHHADVFDAVAIVRGGGSQTDFKAFDDYELCRAIAMFPAPVFTGIGHDRNTSIADMMARQLKTPTKVAAAFVDINLGFESELMDIKASIEDAVQSRLMQADHQLRRWTEKLYRQVPQRIASTKEQLTAWWHQIDKDARWQVRQKQERIVRMEALLQLSSQNSLRRKHLALQSTDRLLKQLSPDTILQRGFAMVMQEDNIITSAKQLQDHQPMHTVFKDGSAESTITKITTHE